MNMTLLMASPRERGNTAALVEPFLDQCRELGTRTRTISLYDSCVAPCLGCMACQSCPDGLGCVQDDDLEEILSAMLDSDVIVLATPIYAFFCTAPMKALLDRVIYAGNKNYGPVKGVHLLRGKRLALIATCGYRPENGADLWEEAIRRFCRHSKMDYMGLFCRRDMGAGQPFMDESRAQAVRDFARALHLAIELEERA